MYICIYSAEGLSTSQVESAAYESSVECLPVASDASGWATVFGWSGGDDRAHVQGLNMTGWW